ncbi:chorismate mutase [Endogone sp. FLAS-F59071]|nr:chorismate mutase [Endogone sp. FLAS-F59071]|eukprot:RUS22124.1 chorismate mutase [Endogone sp. FLAS-F59071]
MSSTTRSTIFTSKTCAADLSRRIHYGKIVAESNFVGPQAAQYSALIKKQDVAGVTALLTDATQEATVIARATAKVTYYGQTLNLVNGVLVLSGIDKIPPVAVTNLYQNYVIHRLDN